MFEQLLALMIDEALENTDDTNTGMYPNGANEPDFAGIIPDREENDEP